MEHSTHLHMDWIHWRCFPTFKLAIPSLEWEESAATTDLPTMIAILRNEMIWQESNALLLADNENINKNVPVKLTNACHAKYLVTDEDLETEIAEHLNKPKLEVLSFNSLIGS